MCAGPVPISSEQAAMNSFAQSAAVQSFLVREKRQVLVAEPRNTGSAVGAAAAAALLAEMGQLGFTLDGDACARVAQLSASELVALWDPVEPHSLQSVLRETVGAHVRYVPLYRNFPVGVPPLGQTNFLRLLGYVESALGQVIWANKQAGRFVGSSHTVLSCGHVVNHALFDLEAYGACPICQRQVPELNKDPVAMPPLKELTPLKVLKLATDADVLRAFTNVLGSRTSVPDSHLAFVTAVVTLDPVAAVAAMPAQMPFKEVAMHTLSQLMLQDPATPALAVHVKTPTDVLRLAVALNAGDVSLAENTRLKLKNPQRQALMRTLEQLPQDVDATTEEMLKHRGRWLRLGEVLHPAKYSKRFPKTDACFDRLRNCEGDISTFAARVERLLPMTNMGSLGTGPQSLLPKAHLGDDGAELLSLLSSRPGEFARKLDALYRSNLSSDQVSEAFARVISSVSTPILLALLGHFRGRGQAEPYRAFMPKGSLAKMYVAQGDTREPLDLADRLAILAMARTELTRRFSERAPLGKVYVDSKLEQVLVPFSQRSASAGMVCVPRGSRFALNPNKAFVRLFMHWKGEHEYSHIDVDLSAGLYDDDWSEIGHIDWTCTHSYGRSVHSGDLRSGSGPDGAAEFIDIDLQAMRDAGVRYVSVNVYSYTGQCLDAFPCFAGFMERDEPSKGQHIEPATVTHKFSVADACTAKVPMVLDLHAGEVIWVDMALSGAHGGYSVRSTSSRTVPMLRAIVDMSKKRVSLAELLELHAESRGESVDSPEGADVVFDLSVLGKMDELAADFL